VSLDWKVTHDKVAAVSKSTVWLPIETCPKGLKCLLLGAGGVALLGTYNGDPFFTDWHPLPRRRSDDS
jgi:hypothetical protein